MNKKIQFFIFITLVTIIAVSTGFHFILNQGKTKLVTPTADKPVIEENQATEELKTIIKPTDRINKNGSDDQIDQEIEALNYNLGKLDTDLNNIDSALNESLPVFE